MFWNKEMFYSDCFFIFAAEYVIKNICAIQIELKLIHKLLVRVHQYNLFGWNVRVYSIKRNTDLLVTSKETDLKSNAEKTKHTLMLHADKAVKMTTQKQLIHPLQMWQSRNIWEGHKEVKISCPTNCRIDQIRAMPVAIQGKKNVCLPFCCLRIERFKYREPWFGNWSVTSREESRLRVLKNRELR
jgi:hypothetical protein